MTFNTAPTFDPSAFSTLTFSGGAVIRNWDVETLVQGWVSGSFANYGMWIEEVPVQGAFGAALWSSDDGNPARRPSLTIDYSEAAAPVPEPASLLLVGSSLVLIARLVRRRARQRRSLDSHPV